MWKRKLKLSIVALQETHFAEDAAVQFSKKLGKYWRHACSPSKNASQGIHVAWNATIMDIKVIAKIDQFISLIMDNKRYAPWLVTIFHGSYI